MSGKNKKYTFLSLLLFILAAPFFLCPAQLLDSPYPKIKQKLAQGWNTWNSRNVLCHVLLPDCLALSLAFKQPQAFDEPYLREALIGRYGENVEKIRPGLHALNGRYSQLEIRWQRLHVSIESATVGNDLVILVTPFPDSDAHELLILESGLLWNRPGSLSAADDFLRAVLPSRTVEVFVTEKTIQDVYVETLTPFLVLAVDRPIGISTGQKRSAEEISAIIAQSKSELQKESECFADLAENWLAIQSGIAWNTIYEPKLDRVVSTVGRMWNLEYGGYALFGWDNFFLAYVSSLFSRELAFANVIEHLRGKTDEGFIPNDNSGNGRKSFDRSQPPVGSIMVREIARRYPEKWFLQTVFPELLAWNRFWPKKRLNDGLLAYGSHAAPNPFAEKNVQTMVAAGYESGMDDSPMYQGVAFSQEKNVMELQDVGLNSLYIADCQALAEIAALLGRRAEEKELSQRAVHFKKQLQRLWDSSSGLYLNRHSDSGILSKRLSPTHFYPLLCRLPDAKKAARMVAGHFFNKDEFFGEWMIPSVPRNDPDFHKQRYWKGAIWPPLNFLTYLGLRNYGFSNAQAILAEKSRALFLKEWLRKGYISENYSSLSGTGDDPGLSSDPCHSWGTLLGMISFIEKGFVGRPEHPLPAKLFH